MKAEFEKYLNDPEGYYRNLYGELGIREKADGIIKSFGSMAEPIQYTNQLWYSKTKPVLPSIITLNAGVEREKVASVGAAIDVLWTLSVVVDDIQDKDETRRSKPAAWRVYGAEQTYKSAEAGLGATVKFLGREIGLLASKACIDSVNLGMSSIKNHQAFDLSVRPAVLHRNYWERDAFFSALPIEVLLPNLDDKTRQAGLACLEHYYIGGQLGNDLQDLIRPEADGKLRLSDVRNGLVTIPIQKLWSQLNESEKPDFEKAFGSKDFDEADHDAIKTMVENHSLGEQVIVDITQSYEQAKRLSAVVMSGDDQQIFESLCESQKSKFLAK
ncbi:hypothetical protein CO009_01975 [Candidatus Shapirobacteria bacterium CG_4_8_14_3_um_filter_35_11]|uniref:Polyprenyl synthetase n=1 Tax=Candidatus Shapirobacteria bacterium CG_4_8_14_3_um_filter_35_11 TaxID=1974874 RepID=A0A2M8GJS1_9BACT|nr:MAG: hypothetical protein CO009_01975 [Candidatus Shapirobacteria bacterium CG_4_8_14_3_um_filter_35_11]